MGTKYCSFHEIWTYRSHVSLRNIGPVLTKSVFATTNSESALGMLMVISYHVRGHITESAKARLRSKFQGHPGAAFQGH